MNDFTSAMKIEAADQKPEQFFLPLSRAQRGRGANHAVQDRSEPATACWNTCLPAAQPVRSVLKR